MSPSNISSTLNRSNDMIEMSPNNTSSTLNNNNNNNSGKCEPNGGSEGKNEKQEFWSFKDMVDEAKGQVMFSIPMTVANFCYYFMAIVAVMFTGHLGDTELAASNVANAWASVSGFAFMVGASGALETLCGQGYGARHYRLLGLYLQASCIISLFFSIMISIFWVFSGYVLVFLHQDPEISKMAALYLKFLIPGLFAYGLLQNIIRFLQTQSVVYPLVAFSLFALAFHTGIAYVLIHLTPLGFKGAPLAVSISLWLAVFALVSYVVCSNKFKNTWNGLSIESYAFVLGNLKLALPSAAMICLEYGAFEILVIMSGLMPNPKISTSVISMCVNTEASAYMVASGLSAAASTRVSNELGAGNQRKSKQAMTVSIMLSVSLVLVLVLGLSFGHNIWANLFSKSLIIIHEFASLTPFLVISIAIDSLQAVLSGVTRGCGWQHATVYINLATFYCIGMPVATVIGFTLKLHAKGLWIGLICGLLFQACGLLLLILCSKWNRLQLNETTNTQNPV